MNDYNREEKDYLQPQEKMPSKGLYTFWLVLGFCTGVLWGCLSIKPYSNINQAIKDNNPYEAWSCAKKVRMFALIGLVLNAVIILVRLGGASR